MDQAMGDLQAQLEEMRRLWEEERAARTRAESELDVLRGLKGSSAVDAPSAAATSSTSAPEKSTEAPAAATSASDGETTQGGEEEGGRPGKRQRTD